MTHKVFKIAKSVVDSPNDYPEVIVSQAKYLVEQNSKRRAALSDLWARRAMLRTYKAVWRAQTISTSYLRKGMAASNELRKTHTVSEMNIFHTGKHARTTGMKDLAFNIQQFEASLQVLQHQNIKLMLTYIACVNANRFDDTLGEVGFLRWAGSAYIAEILAWRLEQLSSKNAL